MDIQYPSHPRKRERERVSIDFDPEDPGLTIQSAKDECDVNRIMARWRATGDVSHLNLTKPTYGDYSTADDYLSAQLTVDDARASFAALPAAVRDRMQNDPAELLSFVADPANSEEALALGLVEPGAEPPPAREPETPAPEPGAEPPTPPIAGGD